jgi:hypothetical protein
MGTLATREGQVSDATGCGDSLNVVVVFESLDLVPQANAGRAGSAPMRRGGANEVGSEEVANDGWATADAHVGFTPFSGPDRDGLMTELSATPWNAVQEPASERRRS